MKEKSEKLCLFPNQGEFVMRPEINEFFEVEEKKETKIVAFEGGLGSGKTRMLLDLYQRYINDPNTTPLFISSQKDSKPESKIEGLFIQREVTPDAISQIQQYLCKALDINYVEGLTEDQNREYLARRIAGLAREGHGKKIRIIIDGLSEFDEKPRKLIEDDILTPALVGNGSLVIFSNMGNRPIYTSREFRNTTYIQLKPVDVNFVRDQLISIRSKHVNEYQKIALWSGGSPLVVQLLGEAPEVSLGGFDKIIDKLIKERVFDKSEFSNLPLLRRFLEKLSQLDCPFRVQDIDRYLCVDCDSTEQVELLRSTLSGLRLLSWENASGEKRSGYVLDKTFSNILRARLNENDNLKKKYKADWKSAATYVCDTYGEVNLKDQLPMFKDYKIE